MILSRIKALRLPSIPWWIDLLVLAAVTAAGCLYANHLHELGNSTWSPIGQDWPDFIIRGLDLQRLEAGEALTSPNDNRYPLYPWLGLRWASLENIPLYQGCMKVSMVSAGLLPAALYILGRQLAPIPVALAGSLMALHCPELLTILGPVTDYIFYTFLFVLNLGVGCLALRRGGILRFAAMGACLSLIMAADSKGLIVLLLGIPAALVGMAWHGRRAPRRTLLTLILFALPLLSVWQMFSETRLPLPALEGLIFISQRDQAGNRGQQMSPPSDLGWDKSKSLRSQGHWVVGDSKALWNLPKTVAFLWRGAEGNLPFQVRFESNISGVEKKLPFPAWLLLFILPGCLAAGCARCWGRPLGQWLVPWSLTATFATAMVVIHILGVMSTLWIPRYSVMVQVLIPLLVLAGAAAIFRPLMRAPWRDAGLPWWPVFFFTLYSVAVGDGPWSFHQSRVLRSKLNNSMVTRTFDSTNRLLDQHPQAVVVDLSGHLFMQGVFPRKMLVQPPCNSLTVRIGGTDRERFILQPGLYGGGGAVDRWVSTNPDVFRVLSFDGHIDQDRYPGTPMVLQRQLCAACKGPTGHGRCAIR